MKLHYFNLLPKLILIDVGIIIPMDEKLCFQVCHRWSYLCGHVEQHSWTEFITAAITQVVKQISTTHKLGDNVKWWLSGTHPYIEPTADRCQHSLFKLNYFSLTSISVTDLRCTHVILWSFLGWPGLAGLQVYMRNIRDHWSCIFAGCMPFLTLRRIQWTDATWKFSPAYHTCSSYYT